MSILKNDFLWGGAVAAHQLEGGWDQGGKGVSVADVMTAGAHGVLVKLPQAFYQMNTILTMKRLILPSLSRRYSTIQRTWFKLLPNLYCLDTNFS